MKMCNEHSSYHVNRISAVTTANSNKLVLKSIRENYFLDLITLEVTKIGQTDDVILEIATIDNDSLFISFSDSNFDYVSIYDLNTCSPR